MHIFNSRSGHKSKRLIIAFLLVLGNFFVGSIDLAAQYRVEMLETDANPDGWCLEPCIDKDEFVRGLREACKEMSVLDGLTLFVGVDVPRGGFDGADSLMWISSAMPPTGSDMPDSITLLRHFNAVKQALRHSGVTSVMLGDAWTMAQLELAVVFNLQANDPDRVVEFSSYGIDPWMDLRELQGNISYPEDCNRAGIEAMIMVRILIDEEGDQIKCTLNTEKSRLLNGEVSEECMEEFYEEACDALDDLDILPAVVNCRPIRCWITVPVKYKLR